jgi:hypothetical protein
MSTQPKAAEELLRVAARDREADALVGDAPTIHAAT